MRRAILASIASLLLGLPLSLAAVSGLCALAGMAGVERLHSVMVAGPVLWTVQWFIALWIATPAKTAPSPAKQPNR
jgi:hypothetical protein